LSPVSLDSFARVPLLFGPSPVHRLSEHLGGDGRDLGDSL
jgi:hypothetical protein